MTTMEAENIRPRRSWYPHKAKKARKETCLICFDDIDTHLMFSVDKCKHRFCFNCVKHHIEVKLLDGTIPNCPHHRCKSQLSIDKCDHLLTLKLSLMWTQRIKEESTPFTDRVYCPYPRCSYLMSKTELSATHSESSGLRTCFKCSGSFCINCKVPWHSRLSCTDYNKEWRTTRFDDDAMLNSLARAYRWRRCGNCRQMIERSSGCSCMKCRCGHVFCYDCEADWYSRTHQAEGCNSLLEHNISVTTFVIFCCLLILFMFCFIVYHVKSEVD